MNRYDVRVNYVSADLSKLTDIEKLWSEVTRLYPDGIDILINNAGITRLHYQLLSTVSGAYFAIMNRTFLLYLFAICTA